MKRGIYNDNGYWYFVDDIPYEDCTEDNAVMVVDVEKDSDGFHSCIRSAIWDDMTGYTDKIQNENELNDGYYVVTYYKHDGSGLEQLVDYGISKEQIIANVKAQKYIEGADYFPLPLNKVYDKALTVRLCETVYDITLSAQHMCDYGEIEIDDSRGLFALILQWSMEFESEYPGPYDYPGDYMDAIDEYAYEKLSETYGKKGTQEKTNGAMLSQQRLAEIGNTALDAFGKLYNGRTLYDNLVGFLRLDDEEILKLGFTTLREFMSD